MATTHPVLNFARLHPMAPASIPQADPGYDIESWSEKNARIAAIRKERSRDAARSRRGKENYEFYELAKLLPLPAAITSQLDKASIIRLTIGYLHMRHFCLQGDPPWHNYPENISTPTNSSRHLSVLQGRYPHVQSGTNAIAREVYEHHLGSHILQSLDGYLFALYRDGRFLYISETVSIYLGLSQVELMGCSVFDYVHPGDHAELAEQLGMKLPPNKTSSSPSSANADGNSTSGSAAGSPAAIGPSTIQDDVTLNMTATSDRMERSFLIRMKSTLTKRGVHFKSSGYKVIHVTGALRPEISLSQYNHHPPNVLGFVGVGYSLPPPTISEVRLDPTMFMCKVDLDFTITFCEAKIGDFLDHSADSIIGKSFYSYIHAQDIANVRSSHQDLLNKGQTITKYYRWMLMEGGYVWVQTTATLCYAKNSNDSSFIFINQVLSHVEHGNIAMDISQIPSLASDEHIELLGTSPTRNKTSPCRHSGDEADGVSDKQLRTVGDSNNNSKGHQGLLEGKTRKRPQSPERRKSKKQRGAQITRNEPTGNHSDIEHKSEISGRESKRKANARLLAQKPKATPDVIPKQVIIRSDSPNEKTLTVLGERGDFRESEDYAKRSKERLQHTEDVVKEVMEDKGIHHSPPAMSPINHMQASSSLLALSVRNASRHEEEDIVRVPSGSWENPPNRELPPDHNGMIPSPDTNHTRLSLAPMNTVPKGVFTTPSPKTPDSLLTPPLSDSAKNQFSLPPVSSLTSPKARPTNTDSITPIFTTESSISRYISPSSSKHETVYPIPSPLTQNPSVESLDSMRNMVKQEPSFYNARMLGVPSSYTNMAAYANYGQYNNLQHYNATVNLTSRAYQAAAASYDASMYKNYHTTTDLPIDLSYNGVTGIPIMSPANGPYFPAASRLQYNITDGQLSLNCDKTGLDKSKTPSV